MHSQIQVIVNKNIISKSDLFTQKGNDMIIIKTFKIKIRMSSKKDSVCVIFFSFNILKKRKKEALDMMTDYASSKRGNLSCDTGIKY